jgi:CheY-like chemotaxis protein
MARVLVIDDDAGLLQMVKLMLEREGHTVILAEGGQAGLDAAQGQSPDIAIVDLMMPGISGYDVTRQMRANPNTARIPVLILTARSQPMDKQMAINAGAAAFMSKPISARELTSRITEVLAGKGSSSSVPAANAPVYGTPEMGSPPPPPASSPVRRLPIGADAVSSGVPAASPVQPIRKPERQLPLTVIFAPRPGAGATTIAVNMTFLIRRLVERVCLVDLAMGNGQAAAQLHLQPRASWADLLAMGERFDVRSVGQTITAHPQAGVGVVSAPATPPIRPLSGDATLSFFSILSNGFQQMVADASALNPSSTAALSFAKTVVIVVTDDMATAQLNVNLAQIMTSYGVDMRNVRVVLNHSRPEPGVPAAAIAKALSHPINMELPFDVNQAQALRRGIPASIMAPDSPFAVGMQNVIRSFWTG